MSGERAVRIIIPAEAAGERLDRCLSGRLDLPRNRVQRWIRDGLVTVDGSPAKPSLALRGGEEVECRPPDAARSETLEAETGDLCVLYEDEQVVVVDKPPRLAMHPGAGRAEGTLANRLLAAYPEMAGVGGPGRPGIVHRLDIDTTGVVLLARTAAAYRGLSEAFAARRVDKTYLAICYGSPVETSGVISRPIGRHSRRRQEMTIRADGRPARTTFQVLSSCGGTSLLRLGLETGRTHQIRVHLKSTGHPLVGDPVYGEARWKTLQGSAQVALRAFDRPALHAWRLRLEHPVSGDDLFVEAPVPDDLSALWRAVSGADLDKVLTAPPT